MRARSLSLAGILFALIAGMPAPADAVEAIVRRLDEIEIRNEEGRTTEETVRKLIRYEVGDMFTVRDVEKARRRLISSGLFSDVVAFHEVLGEGRVRLVIAVQEKLSWVVAPTFAFSQINVGGGAVYAENNLWGRNKKFAAGAQLATGESGIFLGYLDPIFLGSPSLRWSAELQFRSDRVLEFAPDPTQKSPLELRRTRLQTGGAGTEFGVTWFESFRTSVKYRYLWVDARESTDGPELGAAMSTGPARIDAAARVSAGIDTRENIQALMEGFNLEGSYELSHPALGSQFQYRKVGVLYRQGIRFFKTGNLILRGEAILGRELPFHAEVVSGGNNLRGYLYRQFRGDTKFALSNEVHHQLFRAGPLFFRGLIFYDTTLSMYRNIPENRARFDVDGVLSRSYLPEQRAGLKQAQFVHGIGAGFRTYLNNIVLPLLGVDVGYSPNSTEWRVYFVAGVTPGG